MGVLLKKFDVPVVMIETFGLFARNPLYNELQIRRDQKVSARARILFTRDDIHNMAVKELSDGIDIAFGFDHFKWQKENGIRVTQDFRADGLDRILYKCACCGTEGQMKGNGTILTCDACGKQWILTEQGQLEALAGDTRIPHIPEWYRWQRQQVAVEEMYKLHKARKLKIG